MTPISGISLLLSFACALLASAADTAFDLTTAPPGQPPKGFRSTLAGSGPSGDWKVLLVDAPTAFAPLAAAAAATRKIPAIAQLSTDPTDERFPLLIYEDQVLGDFTFSLRFNIVSGSIEQMAGVVFRLQDERNFYVVRASARGRNFRFYRVANGIRDAPIGPEIAITPGTWHELSVEARGNRFRLRLDGQEPIPEITDSSFAQGKIGLWTKSDAVSYFADLRLAFTPRVSLATQLVRDALHQYPRLRGLTLFSTTSARSELHAVAASDPAGLGKAAGPNEKRCLSENTPLHGKAGKLAIVTLPMHDRNGDPIAAVRFELESFPGQTDVNAVARAMPILKSMQARVSALKDLTE
jgi:hypothetical protein